VLLSPGTGQTSAEKFSWNYGPALTALRMPWCALDSPEHTLADIQDIGEHFVYAIRRMHREAGRRISIIGHSQGGMNFRWALRFWPDVRGMVDDAISLAGDNHGTATISVLGACAQECPPGAWQQIPGSDFLKALNEPAETFVGISYTQLYTTYDVLATPPGPGGTTPLRVGRRWPSLDEAWFEHRQQVLDASILWPYAIGPERLQPGTPPRVASEENVTRMAQPASTRSPSTAPGP